MDSISTGTLDRRRCHRFNPRSAFVFCVVGKMKMSVCTACVAMHVGVCTTLLTLTQLSSITERFKLCSDFQPNNL